MAKEQLFKKVEVIWRDACARYDSELDPEFDDLDVGKIMHASGYFAGIKEDFIRIAQDADPDTGTFRGIADYPLANVESVRALKEGKTLWTKPQITKSQTAVNGKTKEPGPCETPARAKGATISCRRWRKDGLQSTPKPGR